MREEGKTGFWKQLTRAGVLAGAASLFASMPLLAEDKGTFTSTNYFQPPESGKVPLEGEPGAPESPATGRGDSEPATPSETLKHEEAQVPPAADAPAEEEEQPWQLTNIFNDGAGQNAWKDAGWRLGGNTVQSVTFNFGSPRDRFNGPVTWTDRSNAYQLNQQWLYLERATNTTDKDWDLGGRADVLYGTNARFTTESGLEDNINRSHSFYGLAIPQFYAEAAYKKVKIKAGHFISPVGYFTVDMTQNFFNTIPYTYQYGEPFTHTGALATWQASDALVIGSGFIRGWDNFDGSGYGSRNLGYIGTTSYTWQDKSNLAWVYMWSQEPNGFTDDTGTHSQHSGRYFQTLVYSRPLSEKWNYVAQSDFGTQGNANSATAGADGVNGNTARWYGLNQYLFYTYNEKWSWGANFEWFRDEAGYRVGGFLPNLPNTPDSSRVRGLSVARSGFAGNFYQVTMGPKWQINKNMFLRPNLRFDWYGGNANSSGLLPYGDGLKRNQEILGTDLAIVY